MTECNIATDLTEEILQDAEEVCGSWYPSGRIDWEDLLLRLEKRNDIDLPEQMHSPVIRTIQRRVRAYQRAIRE